VKDGGGPFHLFPVSNDISNYLWGHRLIREAGARSVESTGGGARTTIDGEPILPSTSLQIFNSVDTMTFCAEVVPVSTVHSQQVQIRTSMSEETDRIGWQLQVYPAT
jgi:hypothetical protein